ncbi:TetR/AcrR family transcriptional regulator [Nevskia soli]|uniref:TetR/AcrR family transcriptional regulator n=1 Tax=Nevskia soli TaxID=418856 RepID=UPI0004A755C1|nr:TetR/AcrR family transcriptional regulator [Nevskia soli]
MDTKEEIMHVGRLMAQAGGYQALNFRDIASAIGIKSASIHYHFPTKGDLGEALANRYAEDMARFLKELQVKHEDIGEMLKEYAAIFRAPLINDNRMCLCGILASEHDQLPPEVRKAVNRFIDVNVEWLTDRLLKAKVERSRVKAERRALAIFSSIEGAQLIARGRGDVAAFDHALDAYRGAGLLP